METDYCSSIKSYKNQKLTLSIIFKISRNVSYLVHEESSGDMWQLRWRAKQSLNDNKYLTCSFRFPKREVGMSIVIKYISGL